MGDWCVTAQPLWPWSSYRATVGSPAPPEWLQTAWLLSQFGGQPETASDAYIGHVRAGIGLPSVWAHLKHKGAGLAIQHAPRSLRNGRVRQTHRSQMY